MSLLSQVTTEHRREGLRAVFAGSEKVGKTTLACDAPGALLIPMEIGYGGTTVAKTPMVQSFQQVIDLLAEILYWCQQGQFPYQSLIFDSATALERFIHEEVLMTDPSYDKGKGNKKAVTMESALGGYGKGYTFSNEKFDYFLKTCDQLAVNHGINIILTCHVFAAKLIDPNVGEYDSWDLLLHSPKNQKTYGKREMITQWADVVGFLYEPMYVSKGEDNVSRGVSANKGRVLGLSRTPSYVAGNRFSIEGEIPIPKEQGWNHFAHAIYQNSGIDVYKR